MSVSGERFALDLGGLAAPGGVWGFVGARVNVVPTASWSLFTGGFVNGFYGMSDGGSGGGAAVGARFGLELKRVHGHICPRIELDLPHTVAGDQPFGGRGRWMQRIGLSFTYVPVNSGS